MSFQTLEKGNLNYLHTGDPSERIDRNTSTTLKYASTRSTSIMVEDLRKLGAMGKCFELQFSRFLELCAFLCALRVDTEQPKAQLRAELIRADMVCEVWLPWNKGKGVVVKVDSCPMVCPVIISLTIAATSSQCSAVDGRTAAAPFD